MVVSAVTQIGEHVLFTGEWRVADPGSAFGAHVREGGGFAIHPQHHVMAADTGQRAATFWYLGRGIVRTTGTEMRNPILGRIRLAADFQYRFFRFEIRHALLDALLDRMAGKVFTDARGNRARDLRRVQFIGRWQQPVAVPFARRHAPFAGVVELADHAWPHVVAPVVEFFFELIFEYLAFFFDYQNLFQPLCEVAHTLRFERPCHADFVQTDTDVARNVFIDTQIGQRLARIQIGFTGGHDADARARTIPDNLVQLVGTRIRQSGVPLEVVHACFLIEHRIRPANV